LNRTRCVDRRIGFKYFTARAIVFELGRANKKEVLRPAR
jgi:hypothetical protein